MSQLPLFDDLPEPEWFFSPLSRGVYSVLAADPPWTWSAWSNKGLKKSAQRHYSCMSLEDIMAMPVAELAAPDAALFLWATAPMLPQALAVMGAWGFEYKSQAVWAKTTTTGKLSFGTGYRFRGSHEIILLGVRGNPKNTKSERSVIMAPVREHSRKPDEFYAMVERWMPEANRVELFSRQSRPGWAAFGNEADKFDNQGDENAIRSRSSAPARVQSEGEGARESAA